MVTKKKKHFFSFVVVLVTIVSILTGCVSPIMKLYYPTEQPNTKWISSDKRVCFFVGDKDDLKVTGYIMDGKQKITIRLSMSPMVTLIDVFQIDENKQENVIEIWVAKKVRKNFLIVEVKTSTFFKEGQIIVFDRYKL
ncbi:MAG TPA: hypothetical protein DEW35_04395 [Ruminococcaceae bacterium]|nr:hypothetical protein [Oscillospiraceae bacterium]